MFTKTLLFISRKPSLSHCDKMYYLEKYSSVECICCHGVNLANIFHNSLGSKCHRLERLLQEDIKVSS